MAKLKYLVETSAVRGLTGPATRPQQAHFEEETAGGELQTSIYLRKEFIHRWVCDLIRFACAVAQCGSVPDAIILLEQDFSPRNIKGILAVIAKYLQDTGSMTNGNTSPVCNAA